ncbi:MAG: topoisomerase C-terminal repeat-containing protein, partial [Cyanobacteria bacterium J06659_2]
LAGQVNQRQDQIDPAEARTVDLSDLDAKVRIGRYGAYLEVEKEDGPVKASIPQDVTPADLDPAQVELLLKQKTEGPDKVGLHPETGEPIYVLVGTYGPYVQLGDVTEEVPKPKRASLPKGVGLTDVTLEMAVGLLALPRLLGLHPETGAKIKASLGRFGPYVVHDQGKEGKDYRSIKGDDDVLTITLERALQMLAEPKATRGRRKAATPLRELGNHPEDEEPINIYDGPYGLYIKHGKINASLPEGKKAEDMTLALALELLEAKESTKKTRRKSTANSKKSSTTKAKTGTKTTRTKKSSTTAKTTKASSSKTGTTKTGTTKTSASKSKTTAKKSTSRKSPSSESEDSKAS